MTRRVYRLAGGVMGGCGRTEKVCYLGNNAIIYQLSLCPAAAEAAGTSSGLAGKLQFTLECQVSGEHSVLMEQGNLYVRHMLPVIN